MSFITSGKLLAFIDKTPTAYHCVEVVSRELEANKFNKISERDGGRPELGGGFYTVRGSSIIAGKLPKNPPKGVRIVATHSDSPCFKIKPNATVHGEHYIRLNTERYGSMINSSWLDRPLRIAGRVTYQGECGEICSKNITLDNKVIIPNVAPHLNPKINDGYVYNAKTDLVPLMSTALKNINFKDKIAYLDKDILGYDMYIVNAQRGEIWGEDYEFISAPRLDDSSCVFASLEALLESENDEYATIIAIFDNEEVGSCSFCGADSTFLKDTVDKICATINVDLPQFLANSFLISADNAHAIHPNLPELCDRMNAPVLGGGVVIKYNANQRYITNAESAARVKQLCEKADLPYQCYTNRSDIAGGSTLGSLSSSQLSILGADVGLAQLAMHSAYETASKEDLLSIISLFKVFFS